MTTVRTGRGWNVSDEDLVRQYQETDCPEAVAEMWQRYRGRVRGMITGLGRPCHLPAIEQEEAMAAAYVVMWQLMWSYDSSRAKRCSFRTYVERAVRRRVLDQIRRFRRYERHLNRSQDISTVLAPGLDQWPDETPAFGVLRPYAPDASSVAEQHEFQARFDQAINHLDAGERWLWNQKAEGKKLAEMAREHHLSIGQVRYRWLRVEENLRRLLPELADQRSAANELAVGAVAPAWPGAEGPQTVGLATRPTAPWCAARRLAQVG